MIIINSLEEDLSRGPLHIQKNIDKLEIKLDEDTQQKFLSIYKISPMELEGVKK